MSRQVLELPVRPRPRRAIRNPTPEQRSLRIPPFDRSGPPRAPAGPRMNEQIRIPQVRLIGAEGEQHGIVPTVQALEMARELGLDLVEVADKERPPVCKIMDYGKHKYAQSKKQATKTHQQKLKELRVRPKTGEHDVDTRVAQARKFLEHGDKVMIKVQFRGREMQHIEEGRRILDSMLVDLQDCCKVETPPRMEGKQMMALLAPKGSTTPAKPNAPKPKPPAPAKPADASASAAQAPPKPAPLPAPTATPPTSAGVKPPAPPTTAGKPPSLPAKPAGAAAPKPPAPKPPDASPS